MSARPVIGINADFFNASKTYSAHARVNAGYFDAILHAGGLPVIIPPLGKEADISEMLDMLDGVLLTGGLDIDPRRNGQPAHPTVQPMAERREMNDKILIQKIVERKMPVLAIGVGMQQLNVYLGGTLFMHIPNDVPKAMPHFDATGGPHRHIVLLEADSKIEDLYGTNELRVNSRHHQAVDQVAPRLRVGARCPDGIIESIESIDPNWFCMGLQWHPEADTASALDLQLFDCFVQSSVRSSDRLQLAA
ncbi:gamma-glutamyl-gamma-aminobutyrate hydrolase family protein [Telmatocola sphagniphila]|jgi:putative glutamine amidotransferase|nr:gamma-glutamyl-gamma-aminobutyrate hydrolase family protein [Telmatocola sphagniphila]